MIGAVISKFISLVEVGRDLLMLHYHRSFSASCFMTRIFVHALKSLRLFIVQNLFESTLLIHDNLSRADLSLT